MKRKETDTRTFLSKCKRVLASTLALAMVVSTDAWAGMNNIFATKIAATDEAYQRGDANGDGHIDLDDTLVILKHAVGITTLEGKALDAADANGDGTVDLDDAMYSLKTALGIEVDPPKTTPTLKPADKDDEAPGATATPKTTFKPVTPNALSVVTGQSVQLADDIEEYSTAFVENYKDNEGMYATYNNADGEEENGIKIQNPIAGRRDLYETVASATSLEAEPGKVNIWTLTGASLDPLPPLSEYPSDADPRVVSDFKDDEVTYTIPEWSTGLTVSFWAKVNQTNNNADPILTFANDAMVLYVRANGSVRLFNPTDSLNAFNMGSNSISPLGTEGEWNYYTVTIANDWIGVYINGQENIYDTTSLMRSKMKTFNGGFMTRINPLNVLTQEDIDNATERELFYYTKQDSISTLMNIRAGWYKNPTTGEYEGFDEFDVFDNSRFRGANGNGTLIMDFLTNRNTSMFIGGMETALDTNAKNMFKGGALVSGIQFFDKELTPEQIASNYEYIAKPAKPSEDIAYAGEKPDIQDPTQTEQPSDIVTGGALVALRKNGLGSYATYKSETNTYTFEKAEEKLDEDGAPIAITGVRLDNPFAAIKNGDDKSYLRETLEEALKGQSIFPYKYPDDYEDSELAGQFIAKSQHGEGWTGHGGCDRYSIEPHYGNFYDKYYGDVYKYGNEMDIKTGDLETNTILSEDEIKETYKEQVTTYQRPEWSNGVSLSFWAKPTVVDDSPIITFYAPNKMLLTVDTMGSVCYMSLYNTYDQTNAGDWKEGKTMKAGGEPRNTFATYGDSSYVHAGEWNYYTITFANDWIQVYINGEEMIYKQVNLNRNETKYFNMNYMTRYNPIGIWTTDMVAKYGDPSGKTLEGKDRNYLQKSGYVWDMSAGLEIEGVNKSADSAAIRANNVYENPFAGHAGSELLMTLMTDTSSRLYIGGIDGALKTSEQFTFSTVYIPMEDMGVENVHSKPIIYKKENVMQGSATSQKPIYVNADVLAVSKDTEGAVLLEGVTDYQGNEIYVNGACNFLPDAAPDADGKLPAGVYELKRNTDVEDNASGSRRKIYSSDHTLSAGTQVKDVMSYYVELTAEEVKAEYEAVKDSAPTSDAEETTGESVTVE